MFNWDESVAGLPAEAPSGAHLTPQMGSHPAYGLASRPRRRCRALGVGFRPLPDSTPRSAGRRAGELITLIDELDKRGIGFRAFNSPMDTTTPAGGHAS